MPKSDELLATFSTLRAILKPYESSYDVIVDKPGRYYLSTRVSKTKSGAPIWLGGAEIKKNEVPVRGRCPRARGIPRRRAAERRDEWAATVAAFAAA